MKVPQGLTTEESELQPQETPKVIIPFEGVLTLEELTKDAASIADELEVTTEEPHYIHDFSTRANGYLLTKKNIKKVMNIDYKHKEKEEWIDVYLIEYQEEKVEDDYTGIITKQKILKNKPKQEEGTLRFLVKDNYAVLIHMYTKEVKGATDKVFQYFKDRFGMEEVVEVKLQGEIILRRT